MVIPATGFWKGRLVLITGVTGFIGSSLAARLDERGARVIGFARYEGKKSESNFHQSGLKKRIKLIYGKLENYSLIRKIVNQYDFRVVYHLAAQAIVGKANQDPLLTFKTNIEGTWNLLESCREKNSAQAVIIASTDKAYGTHSKLPYSEDYPLQPDYPYDVSKACADMIARSYCKTYGLPVVVTRFCNVYGPGDLNFSRIIPDAIRSILQGKRPVIRSDGTPERDYLYIDDATDLYLLLAQRIQETKGNIFNAGHNKPVGVLSLVKTILRLAGRPDLRPDIRGKGRLHGEIDRQWMDGGKAKRVLGWVPHVRLEEGLRRTVDWYREYLKIEI